MGSRRAMVMGVLTVMMLAVMVAGVAALAPAPPPSAVSCDTVLPSLTTCLSFVLGQASTPSATCCAGLASIVTTSPVCLCQVYNTTLTAPLGINVTIAQQLPTKCNLTAPDPSACSASGVPAPSPVSLSSPGMAPTPMSLEAPMAEAPMTPGMAPTPMGLEAPLAEAPTPVGLEAPMAEAPMAPGMAPTPMGLEAPLEPPVAEAPTPTGLEAPMAEAPMAPGSSPSSSESPSTSPAPTGSATPTRSPSAQGSSNSSTSPPGSDAPSARGVATSTYVLLALVLLLR